MTLRECLLYGKNYLHSHNIADSDIDAWLLLEYTAKIDRNYYFMHQFEEISNILADEYKILLVRRSEHVPLQYLTNEQEFMGFKFKVNENVLIPRQDTEILVEEAVNRLKPSMRVLDMCTGSGCIAVSLKKLVRDIEVTAADISSKALAVAIENAELNSADIEFIQSDLFENVRGKFDIIVSNPPYIPSETVDVLMEEVREHEPRLALDGMSDGLYFYRLIVRESTRFLEDNGFLMLEIGHDQRETVINIMKEAGFKAVTGIKDLAGLDRVVIGSYCIK